MKQTDSINRNKHEIDRFNFAINMNRQIQLIAINRKQTDSINRNNHEIDRFN